MAENYLPMLAGFPHSLANLRRKMGRSNLYEYLKRFATTDRVYTRHDFTEMLAVGDYPYLLANSSGTSSASFTVTAAVENGVITADTGTDDNGSLSLIGNIPLYGDRNAGIAVRWQVDDVSENNFEVGLIDAVPAANASGVSDVDTPAAAFSDGALCTYDTDQTSTALTFVTKGSTAGQGIKATSVATFASLADATYYWTVIQLVGNSAFNFFGTTAGALQLLGKHDDDPQGNLEGGVALYPWIYCRTRNTTAKFPRIDVIETWSDRN